MARIPYANEGQEAAGATPFYEQLKKSFGMVPNLVKLVGHSGAATKGLGTLLQVYFAELSLPVRLREIAYVTAARLNDCAYCRGYHEPLAKQAGLTDEQVELLGEAGFASPLFSEAERAVIRFAHETTRQVKASDAVVDALRQHYTAQQIAEVAFVVASANFIQRIGKNLGVELEKK